MARVLQLICHLEVYTATHSFARRAAARGLAVTLPEIEKGAPMELEGLFNPLLLPLVGEPVPTDLTIESEAPIALVTGPNSGGKTRLLQAAGIAQVLGQSGLYAPFGRGRLPLASGLFASIVEIDRADQAEGRLGTEMVRLRTLFEEAPSGSLVLLDELCSGTNPSEAIEIVEMVLHLLRRLDPLAMVTTHFLDFAHHLRTEAQPQGLIFLQAEIDREHGPTFRFIEGVATTSLAVGTARRLGVTFEELERTLSRRTEPPTDTSSEEVGELPQRDRDEQ
jgi:DNA mismatch repair protein MutS2